MGRSKMRRGALGWWVLATALMAMQSVVWSVSLESPVVMLEESEASPMAALHSQNQQLLQQIEGLQGGKGAGPGPAGPMPMPNMMAMSPSGGGGGTRMEGIKEALTAVKPIMDKYVNTAKTLTGKYSILKEEYQKLKASKGGDPNTAMKAAAELKATKAADANKLNTLQGEYDNLQKDEAAVKAKAHSDELSLKEENTQLKTTNEAVASSFMAELENAKKEAKTQVTNMRTELNRFMSDTNKAQFDALGEATSKAIEEKRTLALKLPVVKSEVKKMLEKEVKEDAKKPQEEWGSMEEEDKKQKSNK